MTSIEYRKYRQHILDHMDGDLKVLKGTIKAYKELRESNGTLWGAVDTMCQFGVFDVYYSDVLDTLRDVYGDEFDESRYITKDRQWRWKNNEAYIWTVYKAKIAKTIEIMEKKGELDSKEYE